MVEVVDERGFGGILGGVDCGMAAVRVAGDSRRVRSASLVGEERGGMLDSRVLQRLLLEIAR